MKKVLSGKEEIEIWSDAVRDFVYIDDIVEYVLQTCFHNNKLVTRNIGSSIATSMSELANIISKIKFNRNVTINIVDNMPKGVYYRVSDDSIDYNLTSLEEGIRKSIPYFE